MAATITNLDEKRGTRASGATKVSKAFEQVATEVLARASRYQRVTDSYLYIDTTDCAKLMRVALAEAFAGVKFSVDDMLEIEQGLTLQAV